MKDPTTYMVTNKKDGVIYIGVTSDLKGRIKKHKDKTYTKSFSAKYNVNKLVWFEKHPYMMDAIKREKQLKAGNRKRKIQLIEEANPEWRDLFEEI